MPTGRVKWFDADKGFGFLATDEGEEVFLHASSVPAGKTVQAGMRAEFGIVDGRRGKQAMTVRFLDPMPSLAQAARKKPEDMVGIVEDLIRVLDGASNSLRRGRYPEKAAARKVAALLRAVADDFEA